jgi:hypothetical protein
VGQQLPYDAIEGQRVMPLKGWQPERTVVAACVRVRWVRRSRTQHQAGIYCGWLHVLALLNEAESCFTTHVTSDRASPSFCSYLEISTDMSGRWGPTAPTHTNASAAAAARARRARRGRADPTISHAHIQDTRMRTKQAATV